MTTLYRYNSKERTDRIFNTTGKEKNPNNIKFYSSCPEYVEKYKEIHDEDGYFLYNCELEITELDNSLNLFDLSTNFSQLEVYTHIINKRVGQMEIDYTNLLKKSTTKRDKELWTRMLKETSENGESEIISRMRHTEFQELSDYENQNILVDELKKMGFDGFYTNKEVGIF